MNWPYPHISYQNTTLGQVDNASNDLGDDLDSRSRSNFPSMQKNYLVLFYPQTYSYRVPDLPSYGKINCRLARIFSVTGELTSTKMKLTKSQVEIAFKMRLIILATLTCS